MSNINWNYVMSQKYKHALPWDGENGTNENSLLGYSFVHQMHLSGQRS